MMNKEDLENFGIWCREHKELINIPIRDLQKLYREFCNSSSHNKNPKVMINKQAKEVGCNTCIYLSNGLSCGSCNDFYSKWEPTG